MYQKLKFDQIIRKNKFQAKHAQTISQTQGMHDTRRKIHKNQNIKSQFNNNFGKW
jgi:hypothetical protein